MPGAAPLRTLKKQGVPVALHGARRKASSAIPAAWCATPSRRATSRRPMTSSTRCSTPGSRASSDRDGCGYCHSNQQVATNWSIRKETLATWALEDPANDVRRPCHRIPNRTSPTAAGTSSSISGTIKAGRFCSATARATPKDGSAEDQRPGPPASGFACEPSLSRNAHAAVVSTCEIC